jgi:hypothetical protein
MSESTATPFLEAARDSSVRQAARRYTAWEGNARPPRARFVPLLLVVLALLFFSPLIGRPTGTLYSDNSDALAQHIPFKRFLARSWQETGEIPLWCPHSLGGSPFVHDLQVSIFYPFNLPLLFVPEHLVPAAFSWLIVLQIILGGLLAYAYAREQGLGPTGSFVTGVGFMLSGKWLLHLLAAGHTIVIGLTWLPLITLCFERSLRRRSPGWAAAAGGALTLLVLSTHPQWTVYSGIFLVVWTAGTALEGASGWRGVSAGLARWVGFGALTVAVALALGAIQLLPTHEAIEQSCRYQMGMAHPSGNAAHLRDGIPPLRGLLGPSLVTHPDWESVTGVGFLWAVIALAGAVLGGRKAWLRAAACLFVFAFSVTGGLGMHRMPGLVLLRGPSRMLLLTCLPIALLAGYTTDRLPDLAASPRRRRLLLVLVAAAIGGVGYTLFRLVRMTPEGRYFNPYWVTLALTVPALFQLSGGPARFGRWWAPLWCGVLVIDLLALSMPFLRVRSVDSVFPPSPMRDFLASRRHDRGRILDAHCSGYLSPLGCGAPVAVNDGLYPVRGYNPLDNFRYKTYLRMVSGCSVPTAPCEVVDGFPLANRSLLDLLGVRYLLWPQPNAPECGPWRAVFQDTQPEQTYNYPHSGMHTLPLYTVYENDQAFPRAFVVPRAAPMPAGREREAMLAADVRKTVLVEGCDPADFEMGPEENYREARITEYQPNQVKVEVEGKNAGWLVLADLWFPGWSCTVDGQPRTIYPGDYLFRTVPVPAGKHEVVFRFFPASYRLGRWITLSTLAALASWGLLVFIRRLRTTNRGHAVCTL